MHHVFNACNMMHTILSCCAASHLSALHKLFSLTPRASKRNITRSTELELLKLMFGSGASVDGLMLCGLSRERRAVVCAGSVEEVEGCWTCSRSLLA